ncbi:DEAD-box ATP-dependent RNA helicase 31 isoform X2 [Impatiens glandulifera]|uniref:DEAD-box ATP-dependent RNA helicase 31 isoform X2 n=1 Tax=Impatiens glandulifera TaxID=253017 RepID=UPI001FB08C68|nr:DEAD-box ATP-dependent RNA helicase 31 isoform X2 [Impatiens glandulifera]
MTSSFVVSLHDPDPGLERRSGVQRAWSMMKPTLVIGNARSNRGRGGGNDRFQRDRPPMKRQRDSDSDAFDSPSRRGGRGGSFAPSSRNSRRDSDSDAYDSPSRRGGGGGGRGSFAPSSRGSRGSFPSSRGSRGSFPTSRGSSRGSFPSSRGSFAPSPRDSRRGSDSDEIDDSPSRRTSSGSFDPSSRNSRGRGPRFGSDLQNVDRSSSGRRENTRGEAVFTKRGSENSRGGVKQLGRPKLVSSDDESDEDDEHPFEEISESDDDDEQPNESVKSFRDLISETEGDEKEEEEEDEIENAVKSITPRTAPVSSGSSESYLSKTRFADCPISPLSLKGTKDAGYEKLTVVQEATLPIILKGKDVLAKAKTGTGKTVAFLLPSIEVIAGLPPSGLDQKRPPIYVLVICPTRELAIQAAKEANALLKYHSAIGVQVVIGGTRLALEQKQMQANPCQILVATPGRLRDHTENTAGFATRLMGVKVLVLDEADHLLDMGFRKEIEKIIAAVPKQRQTLLFSATVPNEVRQICHMALKRDYEFIDTVGEGTEQTHAQVTQSHLVAPLDQHFSLLYTLLKEHISDDVDYKVLVFCTTAMVTKLVASLLGELHMNVREIHSRKPQSYRTRVSDEFRKSKGLILVTSDVSARGVDYPDVTLVIQIGTPADREQYIHRLGRTGRKGKEGQGILMLAPWENSFLSTVKDLPISKGSPPMIDPETKKKVERALSNVEMKNKESAYQAWLGYYNSSKVVGKDKYRLVELANEFSRSMGLDKPPAIPKLVLGKMGLRNIPGLQAK